MTTMLASAVSTREKLLRARQAAPEVARLSGEEKNRVLGAIADILRHKEDRILEANQIDLAATGLRESSRDRLLLNPKRMIDMLQGIEAVIGLPDPVGDVL